MRQEIVKTAVARGGNFVEKAFTFKADAKMFNQMSDKIYSDKPGAIVRELASNAKDAHNAIGKHNVPFDIHLPNDAFPHFSVRDYGQGMSKEEMFDVYITYSESTKTNTNNEIGKFGVGAKSPFSYSEVFTIVSRTGDLKCTYSAYIGEIGIPVLALMNEEENTEPDGLEVIVPIQKNDFYLFMNKTFNILQYFDPLPNIKGVSKERVQFVQHPYKFKGTGWGLRTNNDFVPRLIQGGVFYPIDYVHVYESGVPKEISHLISLPLDLHFEMFDSDTERGNLDVALSREALSYDLYTRTQIQKMFQTILREIKDNIFAELDIIPTLWGASTAYARMRESFGTVIPEHVEWKGIRLNTVVDFKTKDYSGFYIELFMNQRGHRSGIEAHNVSGSYDRIVLVLNDIRGAKSRVKHYISTNNERVYLITLPNKTPEALEQFNQFIIDIGSPVVVKASSLDKPPMKKKLPKRPDDGTIDCYRWSNRNYSSRQREYWNSDTPSLKNGGYYVYMENFRPVVADGFTTTSLRDILHRIHELELIPKETVIYGVGKRVGAKLQQESNWINLMDFVREKCEEPHVVELLERDHVRTAIQSVLYKNVGDTASVIFNQSYLHPEFTKRILKDVNDSDVIAFMSCVEKYSISNTINNGDSWRTLSKDVFATGLDHGEIYKIVNDFVVELKTLWDNVVNKFKIFRFVDANHIPQADFTETLIELFNRGV